MYLTLRFRIEHVKKLEEENNMQTITLNNGVEMPQLGFGVYQIPLEETAEAVYQAIKAGYRLIDTASIYGNEKETGEGIKRAINEDLVTRDELFITSKLFILQASEGKAKETIEHSLKVMGLDYLDLYLIHQPFVQDGLILLKLQSLFALASEAQLDQLTCHIAHQFLLILDF